MTVLVTGANGFIGSEVVNRLSSGGKEIIACVRNLRCNDCLTGDNVKWRKVGGISATTDWTPFLSGIKIVIHAAAQTAAIDGLARQRDYQAVNVEGTKRLASQAIDAGVKQFIFLSSLKVNGQMIDEDTPLQPDGPTSPVDVYGQSKKEAEQALFAICRESGMELTVIRPPLVYGPGVKANFLMLMQAVKSGIPLPFGSIRHNQRSMISVVNLVDFICCIMDNPKAANEIFLVSDGNDVSTRVLIEKIADAMTTKARLLPIPITLLRAVAKIVKKEGAVSRLTSSLVADISKNQKLLNWTPPLSLEKGIQCAVEDFCGRNSNL